METDTRVPLRKRLAAPWVIGIAVATAMAALSFAAGLAVDETPGSEARSAIEPRLVLDFITTVIGQQIAYPTGTARLVAEIVTLTPTERSAWHTHDVPLFAYVLHGSIAID